MPKAFALCGGLDGLCPYTLMYLNTWSSAGALFGKPVPPVGEDGGLQEEVRP